MREIPVLDLLHTYADDADHDATDNPHGRVEKHELDVFLQLGLLLFTLDAGDHVVDLLLILGK